MVSAQQRSRLQDAQSNLGIIMSKRAKRAPIPRKEERGLSSFIFYLNNNLIN